MSRDHLCISQVLRVLPQPEDLRRRWQLWLGVAAELPGGLPVKFVKALNKDHTREARESEVS